MRRSVRAPFEEIFRPCRPRGRIIRREWDWLHFEQISRGREILNRAPNTPLALIILDGFGHSPNREGNAIALAHTPTFDRLFENYPHTLIEGSGKAVGLPPGQMGNSEVGHLNIGAGRIV